MNTFLKSDGMHLPEHVCLSGLQEEEQSAYKTEVAELRVAVHSVLQEYKKGAFVKLNWRSTQDAEFMTETLSVYTPDEVFLQLKASQLLDLDVGLPITLVLRKWHEGH